MDYPADALTSDERARLAPHVTHLDRPVFGLFGLPETVKGALFARYSRYPGTLRRMMLDEFGEALAPAGPASPETLSAATLEGSETKRAAELYDRIFLGYGDDSVAQLGGMHVAAEWSSNVLTKLLQRPRIAAYLEQSTRYIAFDRPIDGGDGTAGAGGYRYLKDPELGPAYAEAMDELFAIYSRCLPRVQAWAAEHYPAEPGTPAAAHERAVKAKALDLLRGLLPASTLSHVGIYATGQTYEQLVLHLLAHPLPEARRYGRWVLEAVQGVMPSFVSRVERPDRGGRWVEFLRDREAGAERAAARLGLGDAHAGEHPADAGPSVRLLHVDGDETDLACALLAEAAAVGEEDVRAAVSGFSADDRAALLADLLGDRENRRHRPGRGLERLRYRFEVVSDYGAFRDLQRHRMLTVQWQRLTPELGADVPEEVALAGCGEDYRRALERSAEAWRSLVDAGRPVEASYAVCLGYRLRYVLDLNARAAMQLVELRSGREGHPTYRAVAHEMHRLIGLAHPAVGAAMTHVDHQVEPRLERVLAEIRGEARAAG